MNRRQFISSSLVAGMAFTVPFSNNKLFAEVTKSKKKRPNIIFILTDDQGWGDLGCYGHPEIKTPHIDRLAAEGIKFESFYVNSPVCTPARAGIMTGQFPSRLGLHTIITRGNVNSIRNTPFYIDPKIPMLPRFFQQAGYRTGHFGKWHLGTMYGCDVSAAPDEYGFDDYRVEDTGDKWKLFPWKKGKPAESNQQIFDEGIRFINENKEQPFYLQLWTLDPHRPIVTNETMEKPYANLPNPQKSYYSVITDIDRNVDRLVNEVEKLGLTENTIFIFTSDNGPEINGPLNCGTAKPFRGMKRSLYEGGIRTPLIVRWKGRVKPGQIDKTSVIAGSDFMPSLTKIAGIKLPPSIEMLIDGEDMSQALMGQSKKRTKPLIWDYRGPIMGNPIIQSPMMALRSGYYKLLWNPDDSRIELYNIVKDPTEKNNIASQHPDMVEDMKTELKKFHAKLPQGRWKAPEAGYVDIKN